MQNGTLARRQRRPCGGGQGVSWRAWRRARLAPLSSSPQLPQPIRMRLVDGPVRAACSSAGQQESAHSHTRFSSQAASSPLVPPSLLVRRCFFATATRETLCRPTGLLAAHAQPFPLLGLNVAQKGVWSLGLRRLHPISPPIVSDSCWGIAGASLSHLGSRTTTVERSLLKELG